VQLLRKSQEQVRKLIAGPGVYICDECIELCNEIIEEELYKTFDENLRLRNIPKPKEINHILNQYVIGQERAKNRSRCGLQPLQRVNAGASSDEVELQKSNILLVGPTGSARPILPNAGQILDVPLAMADATSLTKPVTSAKTSRTFCSSSSRPPTTTSSGREGHRLHR